VISPSILARCKFPPENWIPPKEFLLGIGQLWEPDPWEYDDEDENSTLVAASQHMDELVTEELQSKAPGLRLSVMRNFKRLGKMVFLKQTNWAVSVWEQWASYRCTKIIEESETKHRLLTNIVEMSEDSLKFWLVKFVAEDVLMKNPIPKIVPIRYAVDLGVLCMLLTEPQLKSSRA